ncbi:hypothetical protein VV01_17070 [Luteipulveratus halotolerans]|uniref:ABC3 transporter permease C-terminal domain-containing protein n=2 Tax=Luteipulveratus halotolerans TaxID=1631356 RepID=A0A0L6CL86_9MICO|nr:hypothetical protein VV01_17070 [Luteipulveratus halotolerans]
MSWWASWRLMVRLAMRDVRRRWGRSVLVTLLVGIPTLIVAAGGTVLFTYDASSRETITRDMGDAQARLEFGFGDTRLSQGADPNSSDGAVRTWADKPAARLPGEPQGSRPSTSDSSWYMPPTAAVQKVTGGRVLTTTTSSYRVDLGERRPRVSVLGIDGRDRAYKGMATLTSGRWPTSPDEVLVSPSGVRRGLSTTGTVSTRTGREAADPVRTLRVVGTADTPRHEALVTLPASAGYDTSAYLLDRSTPVVWDEVRRLNTYGMVVFSRHVLTSPGSAHVEENELTPPGDQGEMRLVVTLLVVGVVLLTVMLAGPAFTSGSAQDRQALGQIGSNGATRAMMRRYVLARALVLGALSSVIAVGAGGVLGVAASEIIQSQRPDDVWGPADLRWSYGAGLVGLASFAAVVAALVPAVQASRTNLVQVLRGQVSPRRVRTGWPIVGLILAVLGGAAIITVARDATLDNREGSIGVAAVAMFLGAVMILPWLLSMLGRVVGLLPLTARVAIRDLSRQRGRSVAGVTAILAVVSLTTALAIAGNSQAERARQDYAPSAPLGYGYSSGVPATLAAVAAQARNEGLRVESIGTVRDAVAAGDSDAASTSRTRAVVVQRPGCTAVQTLQDQSGRCAAPSTYGPFNNGLAVMPARLAQAYAGLSSAQRADLELGAALVVHQPVAGLYNPPASPHGRSTRLVAGALSLRAGQPTGFRVDQQVSVALVHATVGRGSPLLGRGWALIITPETARRFGWQVTTRELLMSGAKDTTAAVQRVADRAPDDAYVVVERGPQDPTLKVIRALVTIMAAIMLVVTQITAALMYAEGRRDQATLASVGASSSTRRLIAGWQAAAIGLVGGLLGLAAGFVPGIAATYPLTDPGPYPGPNGRIGNILTIPWAELAGVAIGVPLLAGLLAALAVRARPPVLVRRID